MPVVPERNVSPAAEFFCPEVEVPSPPAVRLVGGYEIRPTVDASRGPPTSCAYQLDLVRQLNSAVAPLVPILDVIDLLTTTTSVLTIAIEVIQNPLKITKLLKLIPGLADKLNRLLAKIPVVPQGIQAFATMVVDVLTLARLALACVRDQARSLRDEVSAIEGRLAELVSLSDPDLNARSIEILECSRERARERAEAVTISLAPVAKLLCFVRQLLSLLPGGKEVAAKIALPDLTGAFSDPAGLVSALDSVVAVLDEVDAVLEVAIEATELLSTLGIPDLEGAVTCAPIDLSEPAAAEVPTISACYSELGAPVVGPFATAGDDDTTIVVSGSGFGESTRFWFGGVELEVLEVVEDRASVRIPAAEIVAAGEFQLSAANTSLTGALFEAVTPETAEGKVEVSEPFALTVA